MPADLDLEDLEDRADLEADIRRALHERAEQVTPQRLRHLDAPPPDRASDDSASDDPASDQAPARSGRPVGPGRRWARTGPILVAACVAVIAVAVSLIVATTHGTTNHTANGGTSPSRGSASGKPVPAALRSLIGTSWRLTSYIPSYAPDDLIPPFKVDKFLSAGITFEPGGILLASDGINPYQATYTLTAADEIRIGPITGAGTAGIAGSLSCSVSVCGAAGDKWSVRDAISTLMAPTDGRLAVSRDRNQLRLDTNASTKTQYKRYALIFTAVAPSNGRSDAPSVAPSESPSGSQSVPAALTSLVGTSWHLSKGESPGLTPSTYPGLTHVVVTFGRDGILVGTDGFIAYQAAYTFTATGEVQVGPVTPSFPDYAGSPPAPPRGCFCLEPQDAIQAIFQPINGRIAAQHNGDQLRFIYGTTQQATLIFKPAGSSSAGSGQSVDSSDPGAASESGTTRK